MISFKQLPKQNTIGSSIYFFRHYGGRLPSGYTELQYISATTTEWINCSFSSLNPKVEVKINNTTKASNYGYWFGYYSSDNHFGLNTATSNSSLQYKVESASGIFISDYDYTTPHIVTMDSSSITIDGVSKQTYTYSSSVSYFGLFGTMNSSSTVYNRSRLATMNCYYCKLWDGSTLVRDFVPAKNSSNVVGMYDLVSNTFFTNSGSGSFTAGPTIFEEDI